ncbi:MAG: RNase adapter RapZ [Armatimonadetes bacterium]|nr:RNase adapter RapZ [Armatimonadota bacterium]
MRQRLVIVTGLSGAGKSTALHILEDLGYYAVDNLPPRMLRTFLEVSKSIRRSRIAAGIDSRAGRDIFFLRPELARLKDLGVRATLIFLDASDEVLLRRFKETRRTHPLYFPGTDGVSKAILAERNMLADLREIADCLIDTTDFRTGDLRNAIVSMLNPVVGFGPRVLIESFGFKYGVPADADLMFDVRFLANPYYVPELSRLDGTAPAVRQFIARDPNTSPFYQKLQDMVEAALEQYAREGKAYVTIAIGCTGGRHRSVSLAIDLFDYLKEKKWKVVLRHRDLTRDLKLNERRK